MCGIGGILRLTPPGVPAPGPIPGAWLDALDEALAHRGPDGSGRFADAVRRQDGARIDVAFTHRRLAILDAAGGAQPMLDPPRPADVSPTAGQSPARQPRDPAQLALVFNGCVYNHRDLRRELLGAGVRFTSDHSDTEAVLHAWRAWGPACLAKFDGMFALALWDGARGRLSLARDRAGEKPLYVARFAAAGLPEGIEHLAFASTAGALTRVVRLANPRRGVELDPALLLDWLTYGFGDHPPLKGFRSIAPGTLVAGPHAPAPPGAGLSGTSEDWTARRFWSPPARDARRVLSADALDAMLASAVASRLESDVPLGCFLSGGVDSSLVALHAMKALGRLDTFTVRMPQTVGEAHTFDESPMAREVARRLNTRHTTLDCSPAHRTAPAEDLAHLVSLSGVPLGDSSLLPTYWVSRAARQHVAVALSGDGGDELFVGYERYQAAAMLTQKRDLLGLAPSGLLAGTHPKSKWSKLARLSQAARGRGYPELLSIFPSDDLAALLGRRPRDVAAALAPRLPGWEVDAPRAEFLWSLPGDMLRKVDTASMAVALEVRAPLLASGVIDAALACPLDALTPGGERKGLLRELARRRLPREIVDRPKMGFAIPLGAWLRTDWGGLRTQAQDVLAGPSPLGRVGDALGVQPDAVATLLSEHLGGRRDHAQRLFLLTVLGLWARQTGVA